MTDVADEVPGQECPPVHAGAQPRDACHRRIWMCILNDAGIPEIEREAQRMEVERADVDGIALQRAIHLRLGVASEGFVDQKRRSGRNQEGEP